MEFIGLDDLSEDKYRHSIWKTLTYNPNSLFTDDDNIYLK